MPRILQFDLGRRGGWGNQLFQYFFLQSWANKTDSILEIPEEWVGRKIFPNIKNRGFTKELPLYGLHQIPPDDNKDYRLDGFYQYQWAVDQWDISSGRGWFHIDDSFFDNHTKIFNQYIAMGRNKVIGAHRRSGDFRQTPFPILSYKCYNECCETFKLSKDQLVFFGNEEVKFPQPLAGTDIDFLSDFIYLMLSDTIIRGNSTFSWWAAFLSKRPVFSPIIQGKGPGEINDVQWVEGNWPATTFHDPYITDWYLPV